MEDFSFRPSYDADKVPSAFISSALNYLDTLDHTKNSLKAEPLPSPLQVNHEYRRHRLNSYENPIFYPFKEDEHFPSMHDHIKAEAFGQEFQNFAHHPQADFGFEFPLSAKLQDYAVDYYRINRSRGPSFHIGPGRKASEDLFTHGFDFLNYCNRNLEPMSDKTFLQEQPDSKPNPTFLDAPLAHQGLAGNFNSAPENNYHQSLQTHLENVLPMSAANNNPQQAHTLTHPMQDNTSANLKEEVKESELEPKSQKKRKANNHQEILAKQEDDASSTPSLKKNKSEGKKGVKGEQAQLKSSKSMIEKPSAKKAGGSKASKSKKGMDSQTDGLSVNTAKDEKSTEASTNVSPVLKKEELSNLFKSKSSIVPTFGHFKQPETAQELLGGLSLPAEVEEYINNSKIFNQIKAPIIKRIGTLTLEERRVKIEKYLEKRKRRSWNKRVNYDCRKKVADNRLRIKGRFVTKDQAFAMLEAIGIFPDPEKITNTEIKEILSERFGGILKKKDFSMDAFTDGKGIKGSFKVETNGQNFPFGEADQEGSSFGSQDDALSENYLRD